MPENEVLGFNTRLESRCALVRSHICAGASGEQALRDDAEIAGHAEVHRRYQNEWHWVLRSIGLGEQRPVGTDREARRQLGASA